MNLQAVPGDANLHIDSSPVTLSDNAVTVHGSSGDSVFWVFSTNSVSITGNTITGDTGDSVMGLHLDTIQGQVSGNQFDGTDTGIFLAGYSGNVQIEDNQFQNLTRGPAAVASGSFATGVQLYADETFVVPVTIYGNSFANVDAGIRTSSAGGTFAGNEVVVSDNTFTGDTYDIVHRASGTLSVNGTNTFDGVLLSTATDAQIFAIEDKIVDAVDVSGYGLVQLKANNIYVTPLSFFVAGGTTTPSIQRGIDAASAGNTVNVEAGTYMANADYADAAAGVVDGLNIDKPLTILVDECGHRSEHRRSRSRDHYRARQFRSGSV